jgi:hypothetical protein
MWTPSAVLIGLGYLMPVMWLWWITENPPDRARGEFGPLGLLIDVYGTIWVSALLLGAGVVLAFMSLHRQATGMRGAQWVIMLAGLFGGLMSGCALAFVHT